MSPILLCWTFLATIAVATATSVPSMGWFVAGAWRDSCVEVEDASPVKVPAGFATLALNVSSELNTSADIILALGVGEPCDLPGTRFDQSCGSSITGHIAVSSDAGETWECAASGSALEPVVSRLWPIIFTYRGFEGVSAPSASCSMACIAGGQDARPTASAAEYGTALRSVFCSTDGVTWTVSAPLPTAVVAGVAAGQGDKVILVGGLRQDGSGDMLRGTVDPATCTISSWERIPVGPTFHNRTQQWSAAFPYLPQYAGTGVQAIGGQQVMFVGGGAVPASGSGADTYSAAAVATVPASGELWYTVDLGQSWQLSTSAMPTALLGSPGSQVGVALRGQVPSDNLMLVPAGSATRVLLLSASTLVYKSVDDGMTWVKLTHMRAPVAGGGPGSDPDPSPYAPAPSLLVASFMSQSQASPVVYALDAQSGRFWRGYTIGCVIPCPQGDQWWRRGLCVRQPFDAPCEPCDACDETYTWMRNPCMPTSNVECFMCTECDVIGLEYITRCNKTKNAECTFPIEFPPGLVTDGLGSDMNTTPELLLTACTAGFWILLLSAAGGCLPCTIYTRVRTACLSVCPEARARALYRQRRHTQAEPDASSAPADSSAPIDADDGATAGEQPAIEWHPAFSWLYASHAVAALYLMLDVSVMVQARKAGPAAADSTGLFVFGLSCVLLLCFAAVFSRQRLAEAGRGVNKCIKAIDVAQRKGSALQTRLVTGLLALKNVYDGMQVATLFCVHPLGSAWLLLHLHVLCDECKAWQRESKGGSNTVQEQHRPAGSGGVTDTGGAVVEAWTPVSAARLPASTILCIATAVLCTDLVHWAGSLAVLLMADAAAHFIRAIAGIVLTCASISLCTLAAVFLASFYVGVLRSTTAASGSDQVQVRCARQVLGFCGPYCDSNIGKGPSVPVSITQRHVGMLASATLGPSRTGQGPRADSAVGNPLGSIDGSFAQQTAVMNPLQRGAVPVRVIDQSGGGDPAPCSARDGVPTLPVFHEAKHRLDEPASSRSNQGTRALPPLDPMLLRSAHSQAADHARLMMSGGASVHVAWPSGSGGGLETVDSSTRLHPLGGAQERRSGAASESHIHMYDLEHSDGTSSADDIATWFERREARKAVSGESVEDGSD